MKYHYTSSFYNNSISNKNKTDGVKFLLVTNIVIFLIINLLGIKYEAFSTFGLVPSKFFNNLNLWQPITYMFLHGSILHILFNMLVLWMFGKELESILGNNKFLEYYFICGVGSGIVTLIFNYNSYIPVVGASGAIYGLFTAYAILYPDRNVYFYFLLPIKIKYLLIILTGISLFSILIQSNSSISHITHLSGIIIGFLYFNKNKLINYKNLFNKDAKKKKVYQINNVDDNIDTEINKILDKINKSGFESLSENELDKLKKGSETYSHTERPN